MCVGAVMSWGSVSVVRLVGPVLVMGGEWKVLVGGFERVIKSVYGGGGLVRGGCPSPRRFG
jgi:hypothetical protein